MIHRIGIQVKGVRVNICDRGRLGSMQLGESFVTPRLIPAADKVYNDIECPELVAPVRDGDAILMPSGITLTLPFHGVPSDSYGRWLRTGSKSTVNSESSTEARVQSARVRAQGKPKIAFHVPTASAAVVEFSSSLIQPD
jgi:hypothetical protein